jgi:hypothetical protein
MRQMYEEYALNRGPGTFRAFSKTLFLISHNFKRTQNFRDRSGSVSQTSPTGFFAVENFRPLWSTRPMLFFGDLADLFRPLLADFP